MSPGVVEKRLGRGAVGGLCPLHTLRTAVLVAARTLPVRATAGTEFTPVEPYRVWLNEVLASGTLSYKGLTVRDLRRKQLSELLGIHSVTISKIANGHTAWARSRVHKALTPFMVYCSTQPTWSVEVGQRVDAAELKYAPPGTGVVDYYGRLWQLRDSTWCPAHPPGKLSRYVEGETYRLQFPARVVYLPPALQADTTA